MTGAAAAPRIRVKALLVIFLLALGVRLAVVAYTGPTTARFGDALTYQLAARALADTGSYPLKTEAFYFRPPGYVVFLTIITLGRPERVLVAKLASALLGAFAAVILVAIAARLLGWREIAIAAGVGAALDPSLVMVSSDVQSEPLFLVLLLSAGFLLLASADRPSSTLAVAAGCLVGLAILTRPSALLVAPLLAATLFDRRWPLRARAHIATAAVLGAVLTVAPWLVRNAVVYREFVPVSDTGGVLFYLGNSDLMMRFYDVRSRLEYNRWSDDAYRMLDDRLSDLRAAGIASPGAISRALRQEVLARISSEPVWAARLYLRKLWDWLRPYPNPLYWPRTVVFGIGALYTIFYLLAARGLLLAPRRGATLFALAFLFLSMAAHVLTLVSWRYRVPYWDPILILYGVFGAGTLLPRWKPLN
jgi:4-amino-4-deoxy-L-arabinose transferase-like glycosyltransferase